MQKPVTWVLFLASCFMAGLGEVRRLARKVLGSREQAKENGMVTVMWVCVAVMAVALAFIIPWQVAVGVIVALSALVFCIVLFTRN